MSQLKNASFLVDNLITVTPVNSKVFIVINDLNLSLDSFSTPTSVPFSNENPFITKKKNLKHNLDSSVEDDSKRFKDNLPLNITRHSQTSVYIEDILKRLLNIENICTSFKIENKKLRQEVKNQQITISTMKCQMSLPDIQMYDVNIKRLEADFVQKINMFENNCKKLAEDVNKSSEAIRIAESSRVANNNVEMVDQAQPLAAQSQQLFSDLFKINENKTLTEPLQSLITILANNENEKVKREYNLIIFGLHVKQDDKSYDAIHNLLDIIGVNEKHIHSVAFLKKKGIINELAPIKITTTSLDSKFIILKAARKLREFNSTNNTNISIAQDMSEIDRQLNKKLIEQRKELNSKLEITDNFYYGIRNNKIIKINKNNNA